MRAPSPRRFCPSQTCFIRRRLSIRIHTARDMGRALKSGTREKAATILHDYSAAIPLLPSIMSRLDCAQFYSTGTDLGGL